MRQVTTCAAALFVLTAGVANAEAIFHASPLPCVAMQGGGRFCGHTIDIRYQPGDGEQVLLRMHGYQGLQLVGLPPFVRDVPTANGRLLRGDPKPGTYTVGVFRDGKRIPTLDMHIRFIQR